MHRAGWQWLLAVCALWVAGCTCGTPPVESELTVAFTQPVDGQRLAQGDDADPAAAGFQYDVVAEATDSSGRAVTLARAKLEVQMPGEPSWREAAAVSIDGGRVHFPTVTLPGRTNVLRVTVEEAGSKRTATHSQSVTVGGETWSVDISSPAEGQVLREVDDADPAMPGYQVRFTLRSSGLAGRPGTLVCEKACGIAPVDFVVAPGSVTEVPVTLAQSACEAQVAECYAVVRFAGQDVTSSRRGLILDTVAPRVEVAGPVAPVASTTFKVEAAVGCCEDGALATLSREGAEPVSVPVGAGGVFFPAVTVPLDGQYAFTLRIADSGGNVTSREFPVTVASTAPVLSLSAPATVSAGDDQDADLSNGVQIPVSVRVDQEPLGTEVELSTTLSGTFASPQRVVTAVSGAGRAASFTVHLAGGANTLKACVRNAAGTERCVLQIVNVSTGMALCRIVEPDDGLLVHSTSVPLDVRVVSGVGDVTVAALDAGGTPVASATRRSETGSAIVPLTLTQQGSFQLVASCPGGAASQLLRVVVDTTPPELSVNVHGLPEGESILGPSLVDLSPLPGMQIALDVKTEPRAGVLVTGCGMASGVTGQADARGALRLRDITVAAQGSCELLVKATDPAGNVTTQTRTLTSAFSGGGLVFLSPEGGRYLGQADGVVRPSGGLTVSVSLGVTPSGPGRLRLLRGTEEIGSQEVAATDTVKTFPAVDLEEGANILRAELVGPGGVLACATLVPRVDTTPGAIKLTAPTASPAAVYNVGGDLDPVVPGIQRPLAYEAPGLSASATVDICSDVALVMNAGPCKDGSGWFTLASNLPPYNGLFSYPDGHYALKAVLDDGALAVSDAVTVTVDSVEPKVLSVRLVQDTNGDRRVNATELPSGAPSLEVFTEGVADEQPVQVRQASNLNVVLGQGKVSGGRAVVLLNALPNMSEADYQVVTTVRDVAGNANRVRTPTPLYPLNGEAFLDFRLDRVVPTLVVSSPVKATLGPADDADGNPGNADFLLRASVTTSTDVKAGGVQMMLSSASSPVGPTIRLTPVALVATHDFTVPATGTNSYTLTFMAEDESGNASAPVIHTHTVDLEAPSLVLSAPLPGIYTSTTELAVQVDVSGGEGLTVRILSTPETDSERLVGALPVSSGVARGAINFPRGPQSVVAEITDGAGNRARSAPVNIDVQVVGCDLTITDPAGSPVLLLAKDDQSPAAGLQYRLHGRTPSCRGRTVSLYEGGSATPSQTTVADAMTGNFSFMVTLADGETRLQVDAVDEGAVRTFAYVDVRVDNTPPAITSISPSAKKLYFVADSNAFLFPTPAPDRVVDLARDGDADARFRLTVTGAAGGSVQVFYRGEPVSAAFDVTAEPEIDKELPVVLAHGTSGTLEVRVRDASGNQVSHLVDATVDVVPPAASTVTRTLVAGQERAAKVEVVWSASGDDGLDGPLAGYDLRWTTNALLPEGMDNEAKFFDSKVKQETGALLPASTTRYTLTLPPLSTYSIQLRPRDEVGNYARFETAPPLANLWNSVTMTNPGGASNGYALYLHAWGDLNADGRDDLVVGAASGTPGAVYVYYGASNLASPPAPQTLTLAETGAQFFGADFAVGDVAGTAEPVKDLLVGVRAWSANRGRVFLYFGRKESTLDAAAPIEFRNPVAAGAASLGGSVKVIEDITGDGLEEILISSHVEKKVYFFRGRTQSQWLAMRTDENGTGPCGASCVVSTANADATLTGDADMNFFGRQRGYARLGDITGDGVPDFTVPVSLESINKLLVYSGAMLQSSSSLTTADARQVLTRGPNTTGSALTGFGAEAVGGVQLLGGPGLDMVVAQPFQHRVHLYADGTASGFLSPPVTLQGNGRFGNALACGDLNGDGLVDLAIGQNLTPNGSAFIFFNRGIPGAEFDLVQGTGFAQARLLSTTTLGISLAILDFNGDGRKDLAVGDSQSSPARVVVYY
ncbi:FG-GAP-like repeat-containing protein [Archangium violaceum]|uniref:FG-GAP-like repeat-containing protein n=1 Tax=Archangium violaceum TaxID=83451 RepID=UPI0036DF78D0